jgi:hypothetical protein
VVLQSQLQFPQGKVGLPPQLGTHMLFDGGRDPTHRSIPRLPNTLFLPMLDLLPADFLYVISTYPKPFRQLALRHSTALVGLQNAAPQIVCKRSRHLLTRVADFFATLSLSTLAYFGYIYLGTALVRVFQSSFSVAGPAIASSIAPWVASSRRRRAILKIRQKIIMGGTARIRIPWRCARIATSFAAAAVV